MSWRLGRYVGLVGALALVGAAAWLGLRDARPNVLLIVVDTLRRDHVGVYGYDRDVTPSIDAFFAGAGTTFEHATSPAPCTVPAVKQMLTGARDFDDRRPRLAELLSQAGYATAAIVSQHQFRNEQGPFPEYARGFDAFDIQGNHQLDHHGMTTRDAREVSDRTIAWLESRPRWRPFFAWVHYFDPHDPYWPPVAYRASETPDESITGDRRAYLKRALAKALATASDTEKEAINARSNAHTHFGHIFTPTQVTTLRAYYDAEIRYADEQIGRVLRWLEDAGLRDDTLVVLTSDHGERLGEDERWGHCSSLHGREIDVPLLIAGGERPAAGRVGAAASTLDITPTVLEAVGLPVDATAFDGRSLFAAADNTRLIYTIWLREKAIQDASWKLSVSAAEDRRALFNLTDDPAETRDRTSDAPEHLTRLAATLTEMGTDDTAMQERLAETLDRLRAMGYVE